MATRAARALAAVEAAGVEGWALLGVGRGRARLYLDGVETASVGASAEPEAARVLVDSIAPPATGERVFLLGYEAAVALHPDAPRREPDPTLGPAAFVRDYASWLDLEHSDGPLGRPVGEGPALTAALAQAGAPALPDAGRLELQAAPGEEARHRGRVAACREALAAGVLYQANLAHRLRVSPVARGAALRFWAERAAGPAYSAAVDVPGWGLLLSLSPECFLRYALSTGAAPGRAEAWPIKGTRPRGRTDDEDAALLAELLASEKDRAEHVMIVDLLRNDLGRVARVGGVTVSALMQPLPVKNVHHLESVIEAELRPGCTLGELLVATAPGGSITGAPKSAALELIHELESGPRGAYTGNLGWVDAGGKGEASILIRTWLRPDEGPGALHVGGGIVIDSDPAAEWQETLDKAAAFGRVEL